MQLLTKEVERTIPALGSQDAKDPREVLVRVHWFSPYSGWDWWCLEADRQDDGGLLCFGLVRGFEAELGYWTLLELEQARGPAGVPLVERDAHWPKDVTLDSVLRRCGLDSLADSLRRAPAEHDAERP